MPLNYSDVKSADLSKLAAAVDEWSGLSGKFEQVGTTFNTEVVKGLRNSNWEGEAAESAFLRFREIRYQINAAAKEASSIHGLLSDGLRDFRAAKSTLDSIALDLDGHVHLSVNRHDGSVYVDPDKVDPEQHSALQRSYLDTIRAYREKTRQALESAGEADSTLRWALRDLSEYTLGFNDGAYNSLKDARENRSRSGRDVHTKISLKEISDKEIQTRIDNASHGKPGSSVLKPAVEFLSYRAWMNSADSLRKREWANAKSYFINGTPAYAAGMEAWLMETSGGGGRHRKPTLMNKAGVVGGKIFGFPAGVVATGLDFYYTPAQHASDDPSAKIMAPKDPGKVHWK